LVNMVHAIFGCVRLPSDYSSVYVFLKNMAFQQLWLQGRLSTADLGRQVLLFQKLPRDSLFDRLFEQRVGISISTFLELSIALVCRFRVETKELYISESYFRAVAQQYEPGTIAQFLKTFSLDKDSLPEFLATADKRIHDFEFKLWEQTPLIKKPLLKLGENFLCYSPTVLLMALKTFIYDTLKHENAEVFSPAFGSVFERYVGLGLDYIGQDYLREGELQKYYPKSSVVDYLVLFPGVTVLVESKAIEMSPLARVSDDARIINRNLRDSVIKAIKQGLTVASQLIREPKIPGASISAEKLFLLVITFKDLYMGNGRDFIQALGAEQDIKEFIARQGQIDNAIPYEHIYFLSVQEFEWFAYVARNQIVADILRQIVLADASPEKKFQFSQRLEAMFKNIEVPKYITEPADEIFGRLIQMIK
jgi:hypothetical protein